MNKKYVQISRNAVEQYAIKVLGLKNKKTVLQYFNKPKKYKETKEKLRTMFYSAELLGKGNLFVNQDNATYYTNKGYTFVIKNNKIITFY